MNDANSKPNNVPFVFRDGKADAHILATSDLTQHGEQPVIDMLAALRPAFESGKGTICVQAGVSDEELLATIKTALSFGQPFTVLPPQPDEMHFMVTERTKDALRNAADNLRKTGVMGPFNKNQ